MKSQQTGILQSITSRRTGILQVAIHSCRGYNCHRDCPVTIDLCNDLLNKYSLKLDNHAKIMDSARQACRCYVTEHKDLYTPEELVEAFL